MSAENASVRAIRDKLAREYEQGVDEGYSAPPAMLPDFFYKPYVSLGPRERGWIFGRCLKHWEWEQENPIAPVVESC
jgi:hypothetical protein